MIREAYTAGFYSSPWRTTYPRVQIPTAEQLIAGQRLTRSRAGTVVPTIARASLDGSSVQRPHRNRTRI